MSMLDCSTLLHQNSSAACPQAETEKTARFTFLGKLTVLVALSEGSVKTLAALASPFRAEIGIISDAGSTVSWAVKNVAVRVVLKAPVYVESIKLPRSKMSFWVEFQKYMYSVISFMYSHRIPFAVGSAVLVRQTSVSPKYMSASLSNCRPCEVTVKFITTRLNLQVGGVYSPGFGYQYFGI